MLRSSFSWFAGAVLGIALVAAQNSTPVPPSTWPHAYPGQPQGGFSPAWQKYFEVTKPLPNVTFDTGRAFAGNIPVDRPGHANNTLFFMGFEKSFGSLTAGANSRNNDPWGIWLNGGPGSSSMYGLFNENGPIRIEGDFSTAPNNYSWSKLADYFWVDQPVGVGFSTADMNGYVEDEDQIGTDFMNFLTNLVKVFPSLRKRPLYLTGESYAGMYIPYIMKAYFGMAKPPVRIRKIAIGDGSIASGQVFTYAPTLSVIETYPQLIDYDYDVFKYFKAQSHSCNYDVNLTYPQNGILPDIPVVNPTQRTMPMYQLGSFGRRTFHKELARRSASTSLPFSQEERDQAKAQWMIDVALPTLRNNSVNPWYGCFLFDEMIDFVLNYTYPWDMSSSILGFDYYDVPDALYPEIPTDATVFLNDPRTRAALHAPTSSNWSLFFNYPFGSLQRNDPSPPAMEIMNDLAANATAHGTDIILYSGNDDSLIPHFGTEITIQNTTFGGIQGFTRQPSTPWTNDNHEFAGIVHQERGWTYVLFNRAGHTVPRSQPVSAFTFIREFVLGNNPTGRVVNSSGKISVVGGENATLANPILPGGNEIYYGSATTASTYIAPSATISAWNVFVKTATAIP